MYAAGGVTSTESCLEAAVHEADRSLSQTHSSPRELAADMDSVLVSCLSLKNSQARREALLSAFEALALDEEALERLSADEAAELLLAAAVVPGLPRKVELRLAFKPFRKKFRKRLHQLRVCPNEELIPHQLGLEPLRFFVIADWGYPSPELRLVARTMDARARAMRPQFILALGDNFYPSGVSSISDKKFKSCWQDLFLCHESLKVPWQVCLGNHDYEGNPQAQIDFTSCDLNPDKLWQCPAENYGFSRDLPGGGTVDLFALDTNSCQESVRDNYPLADMNLHKHVGLLQKTLEASGATWKIVFGHHPVHNRGVRDFGEGKRIRDEYGLERALVSGGAQAYFCGHEHVFQHHDVSGVDHFGCGAADAVGLGCYGGLKALEQSLPGWIDESHAGFVEVALTSRSMEVSFVSTGGRVVHSIQRER